MRQYITVNRLSPLVIIASCVLIMAASSVTAYDKQRFAQRVVDRDSTGRTSIIEDDDSSENDEINLNMGFRTTEDGFNFIIDDESDDKPYILDMGFQSDEDGFNFNFVMPDIEEIMESIEIPDMSELEEALEDAYYEAEFIQHEVDMREHDSNLMQYEVDLMEQEHARTRARSRSRSRSVIRISDDKYSREEYNEIKNNYRQAYQLVLEGSWDEALDALVSFLTAYPSSRFEDDARFWVCYTQEYSGKDDEEVFHSYNAFVADFPGSSWEDDAKDSLVKIGRRLAAVNRKNKAKYAPIVDAIIKDANAEVALAALYSLQRSGGENATRVILKTYDPKGNEEYRKKVVMIIDRLEGPDVLEKLAEIAVTDPSNEVRRAAIISIGRSDESEAANALIKLARESKDSTVRLDAVRSLGRLDDEDSVDLLLDIAMNDSHIKVRTEAVTALGRMDTEKSQNALAKLLQR